MKLNYAPGAGSVNDCRLEWMELRTTDDPPHPKNVWENHFAKSPGDFPGWAAHQPQCPLGGSSSVSDFDKPSVPAVSGGFTGFRQLHFRIRVVSGAGCATRCPKDKVLATALQNLSVIQSTDANGGIVFKPNPGASGFVTPNPKDSTLPAG